MNTFEPKGTSAPTQLADAPITDAEIVTLRDFLGTFWHPREGAYALQRFDRMLARLRAAESALAAANARVGELEGQKESAYQAFGRWCSAESRLNNLKERMESIDEDDALPVSESMIAAADAELTAAHSALHRCFWSAITSRPKPALAPAPIPSEPAGHDASRSQRKRVNALTGKPLAAVPSEPAEKEAGNG